MSALPDTPVTLIARMAAQMTGEDEAGWVRFFDLYQPVIRHFAQSAGAKTDSEDVAQDVLVKLVEVFRQGSYTPEKGRFRSYLATITRREVINRWQKAQARAEGRSVPLDDVELPVPPDAAAMLDAKWRMAQHAAAVEHVLTRTALAQKSKDVYRAYVLEERPIGEVAKAFAAAGDFWWDYEPSVDIAAEAAKTHAMALYRRAIDSGELGGLKKVIAEKRIAEVEATAGANAATSGGPFSVATNAATSGGRVSSRATAAGDSRPPSDNLYCVVDLSASPNASSYPVSYMSSAPSSGWSDEYKTTKLVLRRIEPGTFIMGEDQTNEPHRVTLTKPFYIGVFEVTQKQYELVMGNNPSAFKDDMRPVERVLYHMIRSGTKGRQWPASDAVDANSFMGKFRARTRIETFDLPTEAQWEYACRAGTAAPRYDGSAINDIESLKKLGRFLWNQKTRGYREPDSNFEQHKPDGKGVCLENHTSVGSYKPNAWGLFDVYGNVWELCLDWIGTLPYGENPVGAASGSRRVLRGGGWNFGAQDCHSASRLPDVWNPYNNVGFRLALTISDK